MVGGQCEHFERAGPVLACLGRAVVHCGPVGAGQITKSCNQLVVMATHESIAEALVLAQACGLDPWRVREALLAGYGASPILEIQGPRMLKHDFAPGGKARYHLKDIAAISELAREAGLEPPGVRRSRPAVRAARRRRRRGPRQLGRDHGSRRPQSPAAKEGLTGPDDSNLAVGVGHRVRCRAQATPSRGPVEAA